VKAGWSSSLPSELTSGGIDRCCGGEPVHREEIKVTIVSRRPEKLKDDEVSIRV
jgi:hypothetical protein